jgi:predicted dinucleotide-binding enzyme
MTSTDFEQVVKSCVADWFARMQRTGEIPRENPDAVAEAQQNTENRLLQTIQRNELMYGHLLAGDEQHAKDAVNALIDQVSGKP